MPPIRHFAVAAVVALASGGAALAQSAPAPEPTAAEAPASPPLSIDTPIEVLVSIPTAKAVLDADIPGLTEHPAYEKFKRENLRTLAPKFGDAISPKDVAKVQAHLAALTPPR